MAVLIKKILNWIAVEEENVKTDEEEATEECTTWAQESNAAESFTDSSKQSIELFEENKCQFPEYTENNCQFPEYIENNCQFPEYIENNCQFPEYIENNCQTSACIDNTRKSLELIENNCQTSACIDNTRKSLELIENDSSEPTENINSSQVINDIKLCYEPDMASLTIEKKEMVEKYLDSVALRAKNTKGLSPERQCKIPISTVDKEVNTVSINTTLENFSPERQYKIPVSKVDKEVNTVNNKTLEIDGICQSPYLDRRNTFRQYRESKENMRLKSDAPRSIFTEMDYKVKKSYSDENSGDNVKSLRRNDVETIGSQKCFPKKAIAPESFPYEEVPVKYPKKVIDPAVYGELIVLGFNGTVPDHLVGIMQNKFVLAKKKRASGLKEGNTHIYDSPQTPRNPTRCSISYYTPDSKNVEIEYVEDKCTDMFQVGRNLDSSIDFFALNMEQGDDARNGVSRYACRISAMRKGNPKVRIYAAAFDASKRIALGEGAFTFPRQGRMDGFTTNGVLILQPNNNATRRNVWREVSICGDIYQLRTPNIDHRKRPRIEDEDNVLQDGALIDLCGVTLLWRSAEGLLKTPLDNFLKKAERALMDFAAPCKDVFFGKSVTALDLLIEHTKPLTYIYMSCGHVVKFLVQGKLDNLEGLHCPVCHCITKIAKLEVGMEPGFYVDQEVPSHAFRPCGHVASARTVKHWSSINVHRRRFVGESVCPFCMTKLNNILSHVELIFPKEEDINQR